MSSSTGRATALTLETFSSGKDYGHPSSPALGLLGIVMFTAPFIVGPLLMWREALSWSDTSETAAAFGMAVMITVTPALLIGLLGLATLLLVETSEWRTHRAVRAVRMASFHRAPTTIAKSFGDPPIPADAADSAPQSCVVDDPFRPAHAAG
ncbi:MAG: hypothetical protein K0V04_14985 [Deltaproteobacteria bacterium]|nr:hypothetical protein [Deltaproteobacteria bacterium]